MTITLNPFTWIEKDANGTEITQRNTCDCGKQYTQWRIAFRFVEALANGRGEKAAKLFMDQIPGGWVPVFCPSCERKELATRANRVYFPPLPDDDYSNRGAA